jgi:hypothetical protein
LQPYDIEGSVDDLKRPLVRIETPGFTDPLVAFIDTGFNGALLLDESQAARLGFSVARDSIRPVQLASQRDEDFLLGEGSFIWLGERRTNPRRRAGSSIAARLLRGTISPARNSTTRR